MLRPPLDQIDLIGASQAKLTALRREIYPLARRLATKKSTKRRRGGRGPLDFRRTIRASLATGGVPLDTRHRPRRPHKPELVVLCHVSSSVASFARFGLLLVYALSEQFSAVRSFAFVDTVEEVTRHFTEADDVADAINRMEQGLSMRLMGGGTNYGRVFTHFDDRFGDAIGPKTTPLVLAMRVPTTSTRRWRRSGTWWDVPGTPTGSTRNHAATGAPATPPHRPTPRSSP